MVSMSKTFTPELPPDVLQRLDEYATHFRPEFHHARQATWCGVYLHGLLTDGERKSIEPMAQRLARRLDFDVADPDQALQQFVNQSPWDEQKVGRRYREVMAKTFADPDGIFVIDDTSFPKQGRHSVGVQRQYCGALGKRANCQVAPSVHYVGKKGHCPLAMRLYLPASWLDDPKRLDKTGVPEPQRWPQSKGPIALDLLDQVRAEGWPGRLVVADAGYGVAQDFRDGLEQRGLHYVVGVTDEMVVFAEEPSWAVPPYRGRGRRPTRPRLADGSPRPVTLKDLAARTPRRKVTWREGTKGKLAGRFAWLQVWPGQGWATGDCAGAEPIGLLIEEQGDGKLKYAFSNLPARTSQLQVVRLWKSRWPVEQGYQQMKEELGLDHFEGRSWRGFHHHACLVMLAYGFLALEQERMKRTRPRPGKKGVPSQGSHCRRSGGRYCGSWPQSAGTTAPTVDRGLFSIRSL
jgi:SRSO17 transposase